MITRLRTRSALPMGGRVTDRPSWSPDEVDPTRPSVARVYDFYLGGSHNFEADREFGRRGVEALPDLPAVARDNRTFLRRAVRFACAEGIDQFLDLGSGIPTSGNVHEVAREADPEARVVYVDHDPVAVAHGQALLADDPRATTVRADLRSPDTVLEEVAAAGLLDLSRPVAVLLIAVLHFVDDDADPAGLLARYMRAAAPSSLLALSHGRRGAAGTAPIERLYNRPGSPSPISLRSCAEVEALFPSSVRLVDPGVVVLPRWRPELTGDERSDADDDFPGLVAVGRRE